IDPSGDGSTAVTAAHFTPAGSSPQSRVVRYGCGRSLRTLATAWAASASATTISLAMPRTVAQPVKYSAMIRQLSYAALALAAAAPGCRGTPRANSVRAAPAPPVIKITPEAGSAAPDGYAPIPEWLGQTRAPRPAKTAEYRVETVAEGLTGAFCFTFLPDA